MEKVWCLPPQKLALSSGELHIWRLSLKQPTSVVTSLGELLSSEERQRAERFHRQRDSCRYVICRGVLRQILGAYLDSAPQQLEFEYGEKGKPALRGKPLCFNLSHSGDLALYALTKELAVGIDLEDDRPVKQALQIARRFFSPREYSLMEKLSPRQQQRAFLNAWTRKEAYLKATGEGLAGRLADVEVSLLPEEPVRLISSPNKQKEIKNWFVDEILPETSYIGAVIVTGEVEKISYWRWEDPSQGDQSYGLPK